MIQTTVEVGGMACSMCEAHINDAVRNAFPVDKVSSSHAKGKTVILSKEPLDETERLMNTIKLDKDDYHLLRYYNMMVINRPASLFLQ